MNLIFRMLTVLISSYFKPRLAIGKTVNALSLRVLPNDIDINMHMNNGRYLTICDLTRVDMFIRSGLAKTMLKEKWIPIIAEHTMVYKKPLTLFNKYEVEMEITHWDEKYIYMLHRFKVKHRVVAEGTSKGVIYDKKVKHVVIPDDVIAAVNKYKTIQ